MQEVTLPELRCYRCAYVWIPKQRHVHICPRCKSRYWDTPKIRAVRLGRGLGMEEILGPHRPAILRLARKYGARRLRVFGSVRRREATRTSDIDLIVEWERKVSTLEFVGMRLDLEKLLQRKVDLVEEEGLHWFIRPQTVAEAVPL